MGEVTHVGHGAVLTAGAAMQPVDPAPGAAGIDAGPGARTTRDGLSIFIEGASGHTPDAGVEQAIHAVGELWEQTPAALRSVVSEVRVVSDTTMIPLPDGRVPLGRADCVNGVIYLYDEFVASTSAAHLLQAWRHELGHLVDPSLADDGAHAAAAHDAYLEAAEADAEHVYELSSDAGVRITLLEGRNERPGPPRTANGRYVSLYGESAERAATRAYGPDYEWAHIEDFAEGFGKYLAGEAGVPVAISADFSVAALLAGDIDMELYSFRDIYPHRAAIYDSAVGALAVQPSQSTPPTQGSARRARR